MGHLHLPHHSDQHEHQGVHRDRRLELVGTIIMAVAALASAWSGYQSAVWEALRTLKLAAANRLDRQASGKMGHADRLSLLDITMFLQYERALSEGNQNTLSFSSGGSVLNGLAS
jgi:hypothetical protein